MMSRIQESTQKSMSKYAPLNSKNNVKLKFRELENLVDIGFMSKDYFKDIERE